MFPYIAYRLLTEGDQGSGCITCIMDDPLKSREHGGRR